MLQVTLVEHVSGGLVIPRQLLNTAELVLNWGIPGLKVNKYTITILNGD
jgi:hypothetical protein